GEEAHGIFRPAVNFGVPLLSTVALDLCNRQTVHSDGGERIAHLLQLERLYDRHYDFHKPRLIVTRRGVPYRSRAVKSERARPARRRLTRRVPRPAEGPNDLKRNCYCERSQPQADTCLIRSHLC